MPEELRICPMLYLSFSAILALGILSLIIGRKFLQKILGLIRALKMRIFQQKTAEEDLQKEVAELRNATLQISEEWAEIKHLMSPIKDQLSIFELRLDSNLESFGIRLQADLKVRLEEECLRNDQRFGRLHKMVDGFKEDFDGVREMLRKHGEFVDRLPKFPVTEAWTQTERELLKKMREGHEKDDTAGEHGPPRSIVTVIRKALVEFLKEAKLQMSLQRSEVLRNVFAQLSEDREDLKSTIESAFSTATHHTQTNFLKFGNVGRDAMKCIAVLNENTERTITTKFQESSENLKIIIELMKNLNFDASCIKQTLDNIDGQFDEIYKKLELGCQKNADHSEEVARSLQEAAQEWNEKSSQLDGRCKELTRATHGIKDMLVKMGNALCNRPAGTIDNQCLPDRNLSTLELEHDNIGVLLMTVQICQEKMASMNDQIDQNTSGVQQSAELLLDKLRLLTNLVKNGVETLKNLTITKPDSEDQPEESFKQAQAELIDDTLSLDTISEVTEEDQDVKEWQNPELENSPELPGLMGIIDADLDKALHTKCMGNITKNSEFFESK